MPCQLLFFQLDPPLQLLQVFLGGQLFWSDATLTKHIAHTLVVLYMLMGHTTQAMKDKYGIVKSRPLADFLPTLTIAAKNLATEMTNHNVEQANLRGEGIMPPKKGLIAPGADAAKTGIIHTTLENILRQRFFRFPQPVTRLHSRL